MSLTAIINLAERLLNNSSGQSVDTSSTLKQSKQTARIDSEAKAGDQFTPSTATQQDAGLFQVRQISIFSAAADFLFAQTLQPQSNPLANPAATPENGPATPAPAKPTANAAPAAIASAATPTVANVPAATNTSTSVNSTQNQLLALDSALAALGLNDSQLAQIDRIARLIQVFNPLAFTSLVYQLEALAQANASQSGPGATAPGATTANPSQTNGAGGFQIQELVIKFSGVQESITQTGTSTQGSNSNVQLSAFNLQVEEVNLTLANPAGQSLHVTVPQPAAPATLQTSAPATTLAKSAAA
jgi:hypothetical protein